jgi:hypothetical protein
MLGDRGICESGEPVVLPYTVVDGSYIRLSMLRDGEDFAPRGKGWRERSVFAFAAALISDLRNVLGQGDNKSSPARIAGSRDSALILGIADGQYVGRDAVTVTRGSCVMSGGEA